MAHLPSSYARAAPVTEAWIEEVQPSCDHVKLRLLTSDGKQEERVVSREDADWLELAPGQIIRL
jgi:hypothetical protein